MRLLLNLIDHLPRNSFFAEAVSQDDDLAREYLARQEGISTQPGRKRTPPISEETPELAELREINDRLGGVILAIRAFAGRQAGLQKIPPRDRPEVATDRMRQEIRIAKHQVLVSRVIRKGG